MTTTDPDTTDIPEAGPEFFERAKLSVPSCSEEQCSDHWNIIETPAGYEVRCNKCYRKFGWVGGVDK